MKSVNIAFATFCLIRVIETIAKLPKAQEPLLIWSGIAGVIFFILIGACALSKRLILQYVAAILAFAAGGYSLWSFIVSAEYLHLALIPTSVIVNSAFLVGFGPALLLNCAKPNKPAHPTAGSIPI